MTRRQKELYDFIVKYMRKNIMAPCYMEMIDHLGLSKKSKSVIHKFLKELEREGFIKITPAKQRGIKINERRQKNGFYKILAR